MENSWEKMETGTDFILGGSKVTADGDCSHEIKRHLLLRKKTMINLDSILKSRDIILPTKVCLVKAMFFPVVKNGCESWTIKRAEPPNIKSDTVSTVSPSISHEVMGLDAMILVFQMLSFKPKFSFSSFIFSKRLFSSCFLPEG